MGVLARTSADGLKLIRNRYKQAFREDVIDSIKKKAGPGYREVLQDLLSGKREYGRDIDPEAAQKDAEVNHQEENLFAL